MSAPNPEPVVWLTIDGVIRSAYCSACLQTLGMGDEVGTPEEQQAKMDSAFQRHLRNSHNDVIAGETLGSTHGDTIRLRSLTFNDL
jgi:hypothetical protein